MAKPGNDEVSADRGQVDAAHWVRWHRAYEDPDSALSMRLRLVQDGVREALDQHPPGSIRIVSICAGQGRDVIDVVGAHPRQSDVRARLVELDPELVAFARARAIAAGLGVAGRIEVVQGDASLVRSYAGALPADLVLVCGVFGNISDEDIRATVRRLPAFCAPGGTVVWTRHRRPPDLTPSVRGWFAEAGFVEKSFVAPSPYVLGIGCHQWVGRADVGRADVGRADVVTLDPDLRLFDFIGDGSLPA
jgi:SAM-dependent methyltransferase